MKLAVLLSARSRPGRVEALLNHLRTSVHVSHEVFVAETGVEGAPHCGKARGHLLALEQARTLGVYDYVWILDGDLEFEAGFDAAQSLIELMEREPRMAIAAPTLRLRPSMGEDRSAWQPIASCESLGFIMRMAAIDEVGFLDPQFQYGWGAMDALAYRLYCKGWIIARAQAVGCRYLPASKAEHELSFDEYWTRARRFAFDYFRERWGEHWDELFWSAVQGHGVLTNAFREHKRIWSGAFNAEELLERSGGDLAPAITVKSAATNRTLASDTASAARATTDSIEPWPLACAAAYRVLAWPDYSDERELEHLFDEFARVLVGRSDACLCLRFDAAFDGPEPEVVERLQRVHERVLGNHAALEVLLVDDVLAPADSSRLGAALFACIDLPSSTLDPRQTFFRATAAEIVASADALRARLDQLAHPWYGRATLDNVDFSLVRAIGELHPWALPALIGNLAVRAGHGTNRSAAAIEKLAERRARAIVAPIVEIDLEGARVLELGAGFGLFSAQMVRHGAQLVVLAEEREREQQQAELYWSANKFLPRENWSVMHGSLAADSTWSEIGRMGQFDVVLWTDALSASTSILSRVRDLARVATRLLVIDLSAPEGTSVPLGLEDQVASALREQGFELESKTWTPPGQSTDENALRTVLFACKSKVINVPAAALPGRTLATRRVGSSNLPHASRSRD